MGTIREIKRFPKLPRRCPVLHPEAWRNKINNGLRTFRGNVVEKSQLGLHIATAGLTLRQKLPIARAYAPHSATSRHFGKATKDF